MPNSTRPETAETFMVQCPACATGYRVPTDRADGTPRLRCGRCEHVWHHDAPVRAEADGPADEGPSATNLTPKDLASGDRLGDDLPVEEDPAANDDPGARHAAEAPDDAEPQMLDDAGATDEGGDEPEPEIPVEEPAGEAGSDLAATEASASDASAQPVALASDEAVATVADDDETGGMDAPALGVDARDRRRGVGVTGRRAARGAAAAVLCLGFAFGATGLVARDAFVRYEPRLAALYEAIGTPVNLSPFALSAGDARLVARDDAAQLTVTVTLGNRSERPYMIPALDLVLLDRAGAALDRRSLRVPPGSVNGLGETSFKARVDLPSTLDPSEVGDIVIGLAPTSPPSAGSGATVAQLQIGSTR